MKDTFKKTIKKTIKKKKTQANSNYIFTYFINGLQKLYIYFNSCYKVYLIRYDKVQRTYIKILHSQNTNTQYDIYADHILQFT